MCGIAGLIRPKNQTCSESDKEIVTKISQGLEHRGPDDSGFLDLQNVVLAHRRLSILDLSTQGHQPMSSNDFHLTYNGEIYNFVELKNRVSFKNYKSSTDTEVLLHYFNEHRENQLESLQGMFAFCFYDQNKNLAYLARDPFGIKPLYVHLDKERVVFSSELNPLIKSLDKKLSIDPQSAFDYLHSGKFNLNFSTICREIKQVPPGHYIKIDTSKNHLEWEMKSYVDFDSVEENTSISFDEAKNKIRNQFLKNIEIHLRSDVEVGALLSGGIDSSAIVSCVKHLYPDRKLKTFSYIESGKNFSEEKWVDLVNNHCLSDSHKTHPNFSNFQDYWKEQIHIQDLSATSTSVYAQYEVFKKIKDSGIKVVLDGQGADELLTGYQLFFPYAVASLLKGGKLLRAKNYYSNLTRNPIAEPKNIAKSAISLLINDNIKFLLRGFKHSSAQWMNHKYIRENRLMPFSKKITGDPYKDMQLNLLMHEGLPHLLHFEDRNSMHFSIESRLPFLTTDFTKLCLSLPLEYFISEKGTTKHIFREALKDILPPEIYSRRDKIGFQATSKDWFPPTDDYLKTTIDHLNDLKTDILNKELVVQFLQAQSESEEKDFNNSVWRLCGFINWCHEYQLGDL